MQNSFYQKKYLEELVYEHNRTTFSISFICMGYCRTTDMNRLQKLQNRAVRIITNSAFDAPASPLLKPGIHIVVEGR